MEKVSKIELEFAEARKEIMALRLENRKLETALTLLSKPMVLSSDSEDEPSGQKGLRKRKAPLEESAGTVVIALPQGEAQERIDSLLQENAKLAAEIVDLRRIAGEGSSTSATTGVASIFEKNKELEAQLKQTRESLATIEANHSNALRTTNGKNEKEIRKIRYEKKYDNLRLLLPSLLANLKQESGNWSNRS
jgi:hypothetical protein